MSAVGNTILILAMAVAAMPPADAGEIYRCVAANGDVSYTNIACPTAAKTETVARYEPDDSAPAPAPADDAARAAEESAAAAREAALQAREAALEARLAQEQARAEETVQPAQPAVYSPLFVPAVLPSGPYRRGGHHGHARNDEVVHIEGPETPVRPPQWAGSSGERKPAPPREHH